MINTTEQVDKIMSDIRSDRYGMRTIAERHDVSESFIQQLFRIHMRECRYKEPLPMDEGKNEAYQTEEQALSSPYYGATNREFITPIQDDWKLITYEGTIKTLYNAR